MKLSSILAGAAVLAALPACADVSGSTECEGTVPTVVEERGDTVVTSIGLLYRDSVAGTGTDPVERCDAVNVEVTGRLTDSTVFQPRGNLQFVAGAPSHTIAGLSLGVLGMTEGSVRQLIVPPELGFGAVPQTDAQGRVVVPASSTLVLDVRLVGFINEN